MRVKIISVPGYVYLILTVFRKEVLRLETKTPPHLDTKMAILDNMQGRIKALEALV